MFSMILFAWLGLARAESYGCQARCVVLQIGRVATREIEEVPRGYKSIGRVVSRGKRITGGSVDDLREQCDAIARDVSWWRPGRDQVQGHLVMSIDIDETDEVQAVRSMSEVNECLRLPQGFEFGERFAPDSMDAIERNNQ